MTTLHWTAKSSNSKTGPIPVSTTAKASCPATCPFKGNGCYAEAGPLGMFWSAVSALPPDSAGQHGKNTFQTIGWDTLCQRVTALPDGQLWRHNQAGDLPHSRGTIDAKALAKLAKANRGRRGFTYTHHVPVGNNAKAIAQANAHGFTVNLSANSPAHADELADLELGPVVTVLPSDTVGRLQLQTPKGRRVVVCPATYRDEITCASCALCQVRDRSVIVGFPAHGARKRAIDRVAFAAPQETTP